MCNKTETLMKTHICIRSLKCHSIEVICWHSYTSGPSLNITTYKTPNYSIYLTNYTIVLIVIISHFIAFITQYTGQKYKNRF